MLSPDGSSVYFAVTSYDRNPNEVGPKSFIDKVAIKTGEKQRIYESDNNGVFERVSTVLDINTGRYIVSRESPTEVPQQYLVQNGQRTQLTQNQDYTPDITRAPTERFVVTRPDGFKFRVTVTLPQIKISVISAALLAFITSLDEVVISLFIAGGDRATLTRRMFNALRDEIDPTIAAISTLLILMSVLLLGFTQLLQRPPSRVATPDETAAPGGPAKA